jgi:hypothetical protein
MLEVETEEKKREREEALAERVPPLKLSGLSVDELMVLFISTSVCQQHTTLQSHYWLSSEAKQGWSWSVPGWETRYC